MPVGPLAPVAPVPSTTSHVTCPSASVCLTLMVIVPLSGTVPVHWNSLPDSALTSSGHVDRDPRGLELRVELVGDLRLKPFGVERLAARDRHDGDAQQDGGANPS